MTCLLGDFLPTVARKGATVKLKFTRPDGECSAKLLKYNINILIAVNHFYNPRLGITVNARKILCLTGFYESRIRPDSQKIMQKCGVEKIFACAFTLKKLTNAPCREHASQSNGPSRRQSPECIFPGQARVAALNSGPRS
jgi:hypothetical protein